MIKSFKPYYSIGLLVVLLVCVFVLIVVIFLPAAAQNPEGPWLLPVNLSRSGAATNPIMIVDSNGIIYVIWEDEVAGWIYTSMVGETWDSPVAVNFPFEYILEFEEPSPLWFAPDSNGRIHAFWTEEEGELIYSSVESSSFGDALSWQVPLQIAQSALDIDLAIDSQGNMHLAYVRALDDGIFPAGVYYRYLTNGGVEWSQPQVLYQSQYFRNLTGESANVEIATADTDSTSHIYVTWDNLPRKRTYLIRSRDGGENWGEIREIASPDSSSGPIMPFNIQVFANGNDVLLTWQTGEHDSSCIQYYKWSFDGGYTYTNSETMLGDLFGCPQDNQLFKTDAGLTLLMTTIQEQIYLLAWDGTQWSEPQEQSDVYYFEDPETYTQVLYRCRQSVLTSENQILMVGCDSGEGKDIWFINRPLGTTDDWFPPSSVWGDPILLSASEIEITSPVLVTDNEGHMHAFWSQAFERSANVVETSIHYSRWNGENWSHPVAVLRSPSGVADQPTVGIDENGRLMIVWSDSQSGEILFSWADADKAERIFEWENPQILPSVETAASSPDILVDIDRIFVVYAITLNEQRGIYLTSSYDGGESWIDPVQIFDSAAAGWEMVNDPHIARTRDGHLHVMWTHYSLPGGEGPLSLYHAMSEDGGITWSAAELVVESPVTWSEVAETGDLALHRMWLEENDGRHVFQHQYSQDGGLTWIHPAGVSTFGDIQVQPGLAQDAANNMHLIQISESVDSQQVLEHWIWNGERWQVDENLPISQGGDFQFSSLALTLSQAGDLGVIFNSARFDELEQLPIQELYSTNRSVEVGEALPLPAPLPSAPTEQPSPTPLPSPTPTQTAVIIPRTVEQSQAINLPINNSYAGVIIASLLAIIVVGSVFSLYMLVVRTKRL